MTPVIPIVNKIKYSKNNENIMTLPLLLLQYFCYY